jgi:hypothetical protein
MKTIILFVISILVTTSILQSQVPERKDTLNQEMQELLKKFKQGDREFRLVPNEKYRDMISEFNKRFNNDSMLTEHYPGASRYFAKRPGYAPYGNFILEPDTSVKYYLIIKDPLRNTFRK